MYERGGKNDNTVFFLCKTCRISFCHTLLNKKLELTSFFFFCPKKKKKTWQTMRFASIMGNLAINSLLKIFR